MHIEFTNLTCVYLPYECGIYDPSTKPRQSHSKSVGASQRKVELYSPPSYLTLKNPLLKTTIYNEILLELVFHILMFEK